MARDLGAAPRTFHYQRRLLEWLDLKQTIDGQGRIGRKRNPHATASSAKNDSSSKAGGRQPSVMFSEEAYLEA